MSDSSLPAGVLRVEIDSPADQKLTSSKGEICGWFAALDMDLPENLCFEVGSNRVPCQQVKREDVESMLPSHAVGGFILRYDLTSYLPNIADNILIIRVTLPHYRPRMLKFRVAERVLASCVAAASDC
jgi:hypothetical protein